MSKNQFVKVKIALYEKWISFLPWATKYPQVGVEWRPKKRTKVTIVAAERTKSLEGLFTSCSRQTSTNMPRVSRDESQKTKQSPRVEAQTG